MGRIRRGDGRPPGIRGVAGFKAVSQELPRVNSGVVGFQGSGGTLILAGVSNTVIGFTRYAIGGLCLVWGIAEAADLYVSTQGSDSNSGTSAKPLRTISYAYSKASAGTTIHVLPGVYYDYRSGWGIHLSKSGTASSPIVLRSTTRGGAVIDGQNASDRNVGFYVSGSYNTVDGFEIRNCPNGGIKLWANNNRIINNEIHHNGNPASSSTNGKDGVYSNEGTSGNYYACNSIHDNGRTGSNLDHGLYLCGRNEMVLNNLLYRNAATGLQVAGYSTVSNMKVYNNVVAYNGKTGIILWLSLNGVDIKNNIVYRNGTYGVGSYDAHGSGVVLDRNVFYANGSGNYNLKGSGSDFSYTLGSNISADPKFATAASSGFDARLAAGSPAIQAGLNLCSVFTTDMMGAPRPATGSWDAGAYVFGVTPPTPTADPRLGLTVQGEHLQVRWSTNLVNYVLQSMSIISSPGNWADVAGAPTVEQNQFLISTPASGAGRLYRLRSP